MMGSKQQLPVKEQQLFKTVVKLYESKDYKKGMKTADLILKKVPDHGETLCLKGLFCSYIEGRKHEAHDWVKKGLKLDLTSPVCWHVYGLLHRNEKNYEEAIKCYSQSLRIDKSNFQILRDQCHLQIQLRSFEGFNDTCSKILDTRPQLKNSWLSFAASLCFCGKYAEAERVLREFLSVYVEPKPASVTLAAYEESELLLFLNAVIQKQAGSEKRALDHLEEIQPKTKDVTAWKLSKAEVLVKLAKFELAEVVYLELIDHNPDNIDYLRGLAKAKQLDGHEGSPEKCKELVKLYRDLSEKYPKSHILYRFPLNFAAGEEFTTLLKVYLKKMFRKGVPSLFNSFKDLFVAKSEKCATIQSVVEDFYTSLLKNGSFGDDGDSKEVPTVTLWVLYFLAQLHDRIGDVEKALEYINAAITHSPTALELYMTKARIFKHAGDFKRAMEEMEMARSIDLQDRFINTKCTKYMLLNNEIAKAEATIALFARESNTTDPNEDLDSMQCVWYTYHTSLAQARLNKFGLSLKRHNQLLKHFNEFIDDQLDFHPYAIRKQTFRSYTDVIDVFAKIRAHKFFVAGAKEAAKVALDVFEGGPSALIILDGVSLVDMTDSERKKIQRKAKKAEVKAASAAPVAPVAAASTNGTTGDAATPKKVDDDPLGLKFMVDYDHIAEAFKFLKPLLALLPNDLEVIELTCRAYFAKEKYLMVVRYLAQASAVDAKTPLIHLYASKLALKLSSMDANVSSVVSTKLAEICGVPFTADYAKAVNEKLLVSSNPYEVLAAAKVALAIDASNCPGALLSPSTDLISNMNLTNCANLLKIVKTGFQNEQGAECLRALFATKFPYANAFTASASAASE